MTELRQIFRRVDTDGSGHIEVAELERLLGELGLDAQSDEALVAMSQLETARPGRVSLLEIETWWSKVGPGLTGSSSTDAKLRSLFDRFDQDGSGAIDVPELAKLLDAAGLVVDEAAMYAAIQSVDADANGQMSFEEFQAWWSALHTQ